MKIIRKCFIILLASSVMILSSCAPSPVVRVVSPNAKIVAQQKLKSSQMDLAKKQQSNDDSSNDSSTQNKISDNGKSKISSEGQPGSGATLGQSGTAAINSKSQSSNTGASNTQNNTQPSSSGNNSSKGTGEGSNNAGGTFSPAGTQTASIDGEERQIPKNVRNVAAAGIYADMVEMLGGTLAATSQDNLDNNMFTGVFKNASSAKPYMPVYGQAMTTTQAKEIVDIPADQRPQVVICDNNTFSGSGKSAQDILTNAKIQTFSIEETSSSDVDNTNFNSDPYKMILHNVYYFGEMLKDKCTTNDGQSTVPADKMAEEFKDYYVKNIDGDSSSLHSKYPYTSESSKSNSKIESYGHRHFTFYADKFFVSTGTDVTDSVDNYNKYNSNLDAINNITSKVVSEGSSGTTWKTLSDNINSGFRYSYVQLEGTNRNLFKSALQMINIKYQDPLSYHKPDSNNAVEVGPGMYGAWEMLTDTDNVIVTSTTTSDNKYTVRLPEYASYSISGDKTVAFAEEKLHIQPTGIHSWMSGSPESVLEPLWLSTVFYSNDTSVDIKQAVKDFYSKFYHHDLTDEELNKILKL
ncbi:hypothetical protein [Clostridium sp. AWRP]|uniref:hypothetical protein n=1 Tax=Clostridium sp. AWRP TaxID=2212991 RepID=UPI000FDA768B|nr:hypothetical protein [Clostridium sp. AWRP]AZV57190.1 hypothetical protein DMR38_11575 [Clostridium sp. AWRP]